MTLSRDSVLFITLDSCRYDTFAATDLPCMKSVAPLHRAQAPGYFTFASHAAMFVGFTPGLAQERRPYLNPKMGKVFRLANSGLSSLREDAYSLEGGDIICGFRNLGFRTIGTAALGWFDPSLESGRYLTQSFDDFLFVGGQGVERQVAYAEEKIACAEGDVFVFINVGETHVPYYYRNAPWDPADNPCVPFQPVDRSADCRVRQSAACGFVDRVLGPLVERFAQSTILITSDHGDCWGEDGLWEHGISHEATLTVPLVLRIRGTPVGP